MKVGDYVRTNKGIAKIIGKNDDVRYHYPNAWETDTYLEINDDTEYVYEEDVIKSSPNIIDLIEEHDILKIEEQKGVYTICEVEIFREPYEEYTFLGVRLDNRPIARKLYELNIKSIVTKEQFASMEYKVGE